MHDRSHPSVARAVRSLRRSTTAAAVIVLLVAGVLVGSSGPASAETGPTSGTFGNPTTIPAVNNDQYVTYGSSANRPAACGSSVFQNVPFVIHGGGEALSLDGRCPGGDAMPGGPGAWADQTNSTISGIWAPSVVWWNNHYVMYYTATKAGTSSGSSDPGLKCLGMATSSAAHGPFTPEATSIACDTATGKWVLDPSAFIFGSDLYMAYRDDVARSYSNGTAIGVIKMDSVGHPMFGTPGAYRKLLDSSQASGWDNNHFTTGNGDIVENPSLFRTTVNGHIYLFFAGGAFNDQYGRYGTGIADCGTSVLGSSSLCSLNAVDSRQANQPYFAYSGSSSHPPQPLHTLPLDFGNAGAMDTFRTHGGAARAIWHHYVAPADFPAIAGVLAFDGTTWSIT